MAGLPAERAERSSDGVGARLMLLARVAPGPVAMLLMALAGLGISIYLTVIHYQGVAPLCNTNGVIDCAAVTNSAYSVVPGTKLPITIPGVVWFLVSGGLALVALVAIWRNRLEPPRLRLAHLLWGAFGMLFVLYLVYAEIVALHRLCEWCTVIHLLTFATFLIALNRWQQRDLPTPTLSAAAIRKSNGSGSNGNRTRQRSAGNGRTGGQSAKARR